MKRTVALYILMAFILSVQAQHSAPAVKWDSSYVFNKSNSFKMEYYAKNNELRGTVLYKTYYQENGDCFLIKVVVEGKGNCIETLIDKKNEIAIQMMGSGGGAVPYYNAGGYKYPDENDLKKLELIPTDETKAIAGHGCKKYTYTFKKVFGEVWVTNEVQLPNDVGVFRACKMAAKHHTLSVPGFVMEMTVEDSGGGKTVMTTDLAKTDDEYHVDMKGVKMNVSLNKVNYFSF